MLYTYAELLKQHGSQYNISKLVAQELIFKIDEKIYSDKKYVSKLAVLTKRYPDAIITMKSAFYYYSLTDEIPLYYHMVSRRNGTKINDERVIQTFESANTFALGKKILTVHDTDINIYSKERMLLELIRSRNKLPFDYYKEIISNYRKDVDELDIDMIQEYASEMYHGESLMEVIQLEVF